jgi:predicted RND superfamily exporter protein
LSLAFGVFFALFVSLLLVPALYLIGYDWRQRRLTKKARKAGKALDGEVASAPA